VLPFANVGHGPEQEYFADGITNDLTTDLSRISGSVVIAGSTAFTYKGNAVDVNQIARLSDNPAYLAGRERCYGALRKLGMPEQ
jgi:adenylate cyclase